VILAAEVVREAWRDRWLAIGPASVLILAPLMGVARSLALGGGDKAALDLGLLTMWALAVVLALVIGVTATAPRRDLVWALVRPISRTRFLCERALGVAAALALQVAALTAALLVAALIVGVPVPFAVAPAAVLLWAEACVVAAIATAIAQALPPVPAGLCAAVVAAVGHLADEYAAVAAEGWVPEGVARALFLVVPDLDRFGAQAAVVHEVAGEPVQWALAVGYGAAWCVALVLLATIALARRDLP